MTTSWRWNFWGAIWLAAVLLPSLASAAVIVQDLDACGAAPLTTSRVGVAPPLIGQWPDASSCRAALPAGAMNGVPSHPSGGSVHAVAIVGAAIPACSETLVGWVLEPVPNFSEGLRAGIFRPPRHQRAIRSW